MWLSVTLLTIALLAVSGVPGLLMPRREPGAQRLATALVVCGAGLGLSAAIVALLTGGTVELHLRGPLPQMMLHWRLDPLAAFFLVPILLVGAMGSVYGLGYWPQQRHPRTAARLQFLIGLLIASLALVVLAADGIAFLLAWEIMALSAFFLVCSEEQKEEVRNAGWLYLIAAHVGTLCLFALFALLHAASGSFDLRPLQAVQAGAGLRGAIFLTALLGFGIKAGIMPLHVWLPSAHAAAPSHVSAMLSGVVLKVGIYGLLRSLTLLPTPPAVWGGVILLLGAASAILGVLFALGQHDLKRLLAYHSIENIGIIFIGLGLAMIGQARGRPDWIILGLAGCLLHVWNHALFKSLLFLAAGSVIHSSGTREIDRMGGLAKLMPKTAMLFCVGAIAICGLPPLNGFISELLIYLGLLRTVGASSGAALAAPALAMAGALALACFVKAYGVVFLGARRLDSPRQPHEAALSMTIAMAVLAIGCAAIGLLPWIVIRPLQTVLGQSLRGAGHGPGLGALAPMTTLTLLNLVLGGFLLFAFFMVRARFSRGSRRASITWDCGYARPTARIQYTASSFAAALVQLFRGILRPRQHAPRIVTPFASPTSFQSHVDDVVLDGVIAPLWGRFRSRLGWLRTFQQGSVQRYVLYILIILFLLLLLAMPLDKWIVGLLDGGAP